MLRNAPAKRRGPAAASAVEVAKATVVVVKVDTVEARGVEAAVIVDIIALPLVLTCRLYGVALRSSVGMTGDILETGRLALDLGLVLLYPYEAKSSMQEL
jgi:hypothetical protein